MIIVINGPLGIGKSTLAEALSERIDRCVLLGGDHLVAANPPPDDELDYLHSVIALLVGHHRAAGYRHFVIEHLWRTPAELEDLRYRLVSVAPESGIHCMLLTLPLKENLRRIARRQAARALDERDFERRTVMEERAMLYDSGSTGLGEPFDVSGRLDRLVDTLLARLGHLPARPAYCGGDIR